MHACMCCGCKLPAGTATMAGTPMGPELDSDIHPSIQDPCMNEHEISYIDPVTNQGAKTCEDPAHKKAQSLHAQVPELRHASLQVDAPQKSADCTSRGGAPAKSSTTSEK